MTDFYCCEVIKEKLEQTHTFNYIEWWKNEAGYKFCPFCGRRLSNL